MKDRRLNSGYIEGASALVIYCVKRAQTELRSAADGVPDLAFAPDGSVTMLSWAADLRARSTQASAAANKLSAAAASFETLASVVNESVLVSDERPAKRRP